MLFGEKEIKDYHWEEGRQYQLPANSRSELKPNEWNWGIGKEGDKA